MRWFNVMLWGGAVYFGTVSLINTDKLLYVCFTGSTTLPTVIGTSPTSELQQVGQPMQRFIIGWLLVAKPF